MERNTNNTNPTPERCKVYFDAKRIALGVCPLTPGSDAPNYYGDYYASEEMTVNPYDVVGRTYDELRRARAAHVVITHDTPGLVEFETHKFCIDASDLELAYFPMTIATTIGNTLPFRLTHRDEQEALYCQDFGCVFLTIFND